VTALRKNPWQATIAALRGDGVDEHADVAEVLEHIGDMHAEKTGVCVGCGESWPCSQRRYGDELALQYVIRGSNLAWERIQARLAAADLRKRGAA
jgi:hypothetical protein